MHPKAAKQQYCQNLMNPKKHLVGEPAEKNIWKQDKEG